MATIPSYHEGSKAKATLDGERIKGLNRLVVPGLERDSLDVVEFGEDFDYSIPTGGRWTQGELSGNAVRKDTGQRTLRKKLLDNEALGDLRLFEDETDFWALDLAKNENSAWRIMSVPGATIEKKGLIPFSATVNVQGLIALFDAHLSADTIALVKTPDADSTITDSGGGFIIAGFEVGDTIIIEGSTADDGQYLVKAVEAGTLTLNGDVLAGETAGTNTITLHGGSV